MGTIQHDLVCVETWEDEQFERLLTFKNDLDNPAIIEYYRGSNGYVFFVMFPDGSKEGWETSNDFNYIREGFIELAESLKCDWWHHSWGELGRKFNNKEW